MKRLYLDDASGSGPPLYLAAPAPAPELLLKGYGAELAKGSDDDNWLMQFQYTDLFDQALRIAERELELTEKQQEEYNKAPPKPIADPIWQERDKLRIAKQRLFLKLAKKRHDESPTTKKSNTSRDPSHGQFISGKTSQAHTKEGQHDLEDEVLKMLEGKY